MVNRVSVAGIFAGKRLSYDVMDAKGRVILLRGDLIASEEQAEFIQACGYRRTRTRKYSSVFAGMSQIADAFVLFEKAVLAQRDRDLLLRRLTNLARDFIDVADSDPDAAFAAVHLDTVHPYTVVHQLMAALVSARLALAGGLGGEPRFSLICAALTHDIGVLSMRDELNATEQLSAEQRARIRLHTSTGVHLLRELGVEDSLWLEAVRDHHEYLDGSGYAAKKGDALSMPVRILSLADTYSAMLRPRPYRERVVARTALETLYTSELNRYDGTLLEKLIWDLGFYPPGSLLRLANHEIAVAIRSTPGALDSPRVAALTDPRGRPLLKPFPHDTQNPSFAIVDTLDPTLGARSVRNIEQCWATSLSA